MAGNMNAPRIGTPGRDELQVGAHVGEQADLEAEQRAVGLRGDLDVLDLVAAVDGGLVVLAARLGPLDRAAELLGDDEGEHLLGVDVELEAEAAADVGRDDADLVLADAGDQREHDAQDVRDLGGGVDGVLVGRGDGRDDDGARLHRRAHEALLLEAALDDDGVGVRGERLVVVLAARRTARRRRCWCPCRLWTSGRALLDRLLHVDDGGQLLVLDDDRLERVGRGVAVAGDDDRDAVADVADLVGGERVVVGVDHVGRDRPGAGQRALDVGEVGAAVGGDDAGHLERRRRRRPTGSWRGPSGCAARSCAAGPAG